MPMAGELPSSAKDSATNGRERCKDSRSAAPEIEREIAREVAQADIIHLILEEMLFSRLEADIGGVPIPKNLSGYSLMPLLLQKAKDDASPRNLHPAWVVSEFHGCNVNSSTYMLRIDKWKYIAYSDGHSVSPQLFDLSADPDELTNVATKFPEITQSLNRKLYSIIDYPKVSALVEEYNKQEFIKWKQSLRQNYSETLANLRWHWAWKKHPKKYELAIDRWIKGNTTL